MNALAILQRLASGQLVEELAWALAVTAQEVVATGSKGTVTLTLTVSNRGPGETVIVVEEKISRKAPGKPARGAIFYAVDGGLFRDDPRQPQIDFRAIDTTTGEIREPHRREYVEREAL